MLPTTQTRHAHTVPHTIPDSPSLPGGKDSKIHLTREPRRLLISLAHTEMLYGFSSLKFAGKCYPLVFGKANSTCHSHSA